MNSIGIDIGYSSVKVAVLDEQRKIIARRYMLHKGRPVQVLSQMLDELKQEFGTETLYGAVVGSGGKIFSEEGQVYGANYLAAAVEGARLLAPACASIIEIGGQRAGFITGFSAAKKGGIEFSLNPDCSAGTGSFLEEQASRIGIEIEDYSRIEAEANSTPRIAGRCSVFAKTDITHHQQEGVSIPDILRGLAYATARNYRNAVMRGLPKRAPFFFAGGVSRNKAIISALRKVLDLDDDQLVVHQQGKVAGAVGAAVIGFKELKTVNVALLLDSLKKRRGPLFCEEDKVVLPALSGYGVADVTGKHICRNISMETDPVDCWVGVDVGSTSTNVVLVDSDNRVLGYRYLRTAGDPVKAVKTGLAELGDDFAGKVNVLGAATTGSGRNMTGRLIGADIIKDEITAQARAAVSFCPDVDTVFEIGGQDSKFISIKNGAVSDFQMNKVCAAGTGSFIEEQAKKIGIALDDYADISFRSEAPLNLGERCTVFMETSIAAHLAQGDPIEDIAAGLCYSIIKNYTNRVLGRKKVGKKILLQGGVAYNQAIINAFRAVHGMEVQVPPFFSVTGAVGAAIIAREEMEGATSFKGFCLENEQPDLVEVEAEPQFAPGSFNKQVQDFIFRDYDGVVDPRKKSVGMPRALFSFGMFTMFHTFFKALDMNVVLSDFTSGETIRMAQEYALDETCYPVKLVNGHAAELVKRGVDYLFFPDLFTAFHPSSKSRQNYGCPYMQLAFKIVSEAMKLDDKNIKLLAPTLAFSQGQEFVQSEFMSLGRQLGKTPEEAGAALKAAMEAQHDLLKRMKERGWETLNSLDPNTKAFVLISKIYGVADPVLNMGIPDKLAEMGYRTIPLYDLPESDIFMEHPNMFWPFGQHMLAAAKLVAKHPNLYPIFLTHHGCGPDTVFAHYYGEILKDKPSLTIEVDEHSSSVGVQTRVEAFVNSLSRVPEREALAVEEYVNMGSADPVNILTDYSQLGSRPLLLPDLYPYSDIGCAVLKAGGIDARVIPATSKESVDVGSRYSSGNEYFSLTALLGEVLSSLQKNMGAVSPAVLIPQNEGAEVDGQYSRFMRCVFDQEGLEDVQLISPFMEELRMLNDDDARMLFLCLLAGDLVLHAPAESRSDTLEFLLRLASRGQLNIEKLESTARIIRESLALQDHEGAIMAIGEPLVLYKSALNDHIFKRLEEQDRRVIYAPLSEYVWNLWYDYYNFNKVDSHSSMRSNIALFKEYMERISERLGEFSHYESNFGSLKKTADRGLGYYSGGFGRYRGAKIMERVAGVKGVISVTSMYENTGISLGILKDRLDDKPYAPILSLTFDGNRNENNRLKVDSFLYNL
ncbi:acyl-CoA dehydratase activase [Desulfovibrio sp. JC022]|uniref:acyl-CoA dehydratase activase n=1 Tax=Desulfovibrio sp. JC022 TaxID=2593642 RepID=UPI0013D4065C|nr:acyl-CoA dehydratase activase [Desulfovibrio sp. JC022]NDV23357.1 CoA activase [Desulfovibrio sp. JC022]